MTVHQTYLVVGVRVNKYKMVSTLIKNKDKSVIDDLKYPFEHINAIISTHKCDEGCKKGKKREVCPSRKLLDPSHVCNEHCIHTPERLSETLDKLSDFAEEIKLIVKYAEENNLPSEDISEGSLVDEEAKKIYKKYFSFQQDKVKECTSTHFTLDEFEKMIITYNKFNEYFCDFMMDVSGTIRDYKKYFTFTHDIDENEDYVVGQLLGCTKNGEINFTDVTSIAEKIKDDIKAFGNEKDIKLFIIQDDCSCCS